MVVFPVSFVRFRGVTSNKHQAFLLEKCEDEVNLKRDDLSRPVSQTSTAACTEALGVGSHHWTLWFGDAEFAWSCCLAKHNVRPIHRAGWTAFGRGWEKMEQIQLRECFTGYHKLCWKENVSSMTNILKRDEKSAFFWSSWSLVPLVFEKLHSPKPTPLWPWCRNLPWIPCLIPGKRSMCRNSWKSEVRRPAQAPQRSAVAPYVWYAPQTWYKSGGVAWDWWFAKKPIPVVMGSNLCNCVTYILDHFSGGPVIAGHGQMMIFFSMDAAWVVPGRSPFSQLSKTY